MSRRPFRFGVSGGRQTRNEWLELAHRAEDLGFSTLLLPDHFGQHMAPLPALLAAADATTRLGVGTIVLDNDFRHPVVLAKEAATLDVLTGGRFELGIGAGWMESDYRQSGLPFDPPGVRVARLTEALHIIKAFFTSDGPLSFEGRFYRVDGLQPAPRGHPRVLMGASRRRMLQLAAREADIVGLEDHQFAERATGSPTVTPADCAEQVDIVRQAAGDRFSDIELNVFAARTEVTDQRQAAIDRLATQLQLSRAAIEASPSFLIGSTDAIVEQLEERRERLGVSYVMVFDRVMDAFAPIVARLSGR